MLAHEQRDIGSFATLQQLEPTGRSQAGHYRRHRQSPPPESKPRRPRRPQPRALADDERAAVRAVLNSPDFADAAPVAVYHTLLDEGTFKVTMTVHKLLVDDPKVRQGLIGALTDYTAPYTKGCTPPSSTRAPTCAHRPQCTESCVSMTRCGNVAVTLPTRPTSSRSC